MLATATSPTEPDQVPPEEVVRQSQNALIEQLQIDARKTHQELVRVKAHLAKRDEAYSQLKRDHDKVTRSIKFASTGKMDNLLEAMELGEEAPSDDDEEDSSPKATTTAKGNLPAMGDSDGNWGVFADRQWREMLVAGAVMKANKPDSPIFRMVIYPGLTFSSDPAEYFLVPFIMFDSPKQFGVKNPLCPHCRTRAMRGVG